MTPLCPGRKASDPVNPVWHRECLNCQRRMEIIKPWEKSINPWTGHGPCPDKVEMEK